MMKFELDNRKKRIAQVLVLTVLVLLLLSTVGISTYAWFIRKSDLTVVSPVMAPNPYYLKGPAGAPNDPLYIPRINIADKNKTEELFFFTVVGKGNYRMQLGYTTNVPYTFHLYRLSPHEDDGEGALSCEYEGTTLQFDYYENTQTDLLGAILNDTDNDHIADDDKYFEATYGDGSWVQENAKPLYQQTQTAQNNSPGDTGYYVLVINFDFADRDRYNEDVDVICIVVGGE